MVTDEGQWTHDALEEAEQRRCDVTIAADGAGLRRLFAADATWTHSSGQVDSSEAFIGKIERGESRYLTIERSETNCRLYGATAIASGVVIMTAMAGDEQRSLRNRYTNVWVLRAGHPLLVSAQSTKLA